MTSLSARLHSGGKTISKTSSGNPGVDEITGGGLPTGRPTLVCGSAGSGKTLFAMEFLVRGALEHGEPGVFVAFEESETDLAENVASLGFDLVDLCDKGLLRIDHVRIQRSEIEETGEYDLDGLFIRLGEAIDSIGAKRVVLDTIEVLFAGLSNHVLVRSELIRLFRWLKDRGITALTNAERGDGSLTRHGLEEYVSDCVIALEHRVANGIATRRIRVVKYRGTAHGTDEHPFLIDESGFQVLPITSLGLEHPAVTERISTGIRDVDEMLGGAGADPPQHALDRSRPGDGARPPAVADRELAADQPRARGAPGPHAPHAPDPSTSGGDHRSDHELLVGRVGGRHPLDADAPGRPVEDQGDHRRVHQAGQRPRSRVGARCDGLVADGHVSRLAQHRVRRTAHANDPRPQIARHGPLQPRASIRADRSRRGILSAAVAQRAEGTER